MRKKLFIILYGKRKYVVLLTRKFLKEEKFPEEGLYANIRKNFRNK